MSAPCPEISHLLLAALSQANTLGGSDGTIFWNQARASLTASDLTVTLPSSPTSWPPRGCKYGAHPVDRSTPGAERHAKWTTRCGAFLRRSQKSVLAVWAAWTSPLASERQVLTFRTRAWLSFAPPTCRMPLGQASGFSRADPGGRVTPRFRHRLIRFRHFIDGSLALALSQPCLPGSCRDVSATLTTIALDDSSSRWLETCT